MCDIFIVYLQVTLFRSLNTTLRPKYSTQADKILYSCQCNLNNSRHYKTVQLLPGYLDLMKEEGEAKAYFLLLLIIHPSFIYVVNSVSIYTITCLQGLDTVIIQ